MKRLWKLPESKNFCDDFYTADTETAHKLKGGLYSWSLDGEFIFGVIYGKDYVRIVFSLEEFWNLLKSDRFRKKKVFFHNAEFDLTVLYEEIFTLDPKAIFNGKFISASNGVCLFADSTNIFVGRSVKELGKMLNLDKQQLGNNSNLSKGVTKKEIKYCIRDCEIVYEACRKMFEFCGSIKITQASLSLTYYRRFHQPFNIDYNENTAFFWDSYFGGRTEAFKIGPTHSKCIDCNGMYSFALRECDYPNPKYLKVEHKISVKKLLKYLEWYEGCFYGEITHAKTWIGFLPVKRDGKLLFPTGTFSGCWNFNEIRFALEKGVIKINKVERVVYAEKMKSPFVDVINTLDRLKLIAELEGNYFERDRSKRLSNSLYGKLAQRIDTEEIYIRDYIKQWKEIEQYEKDGKLKALKVFSKDRRDAFIVVKSSKQIDTHAIPSFSSYCTSFARIELLKKLLEFENKGVVYCDTDSVFFEIDDGSIVPEIQLGGWKLEKKIITEIRGLKNYKFIEDDKEIWRVKGVPVNKGRFMKIFDGEKDIEVPNVEQVGANKFLYWNLMKTKESLRRGEKARQITPRVKVLKHAYDKRKVFIDGTTEPIHL